MLKRYIKSQFYTFYGDGMMDCNFADEIHFLLLCLMLTCSSSVCVFAASQNGQSVKSSQMLIQGLQESVAGAGKSPGLWFNPRYQSDPVCTKLYPGPGTLLGMSEQCATVVRVRVQPLESTVRGLDLSATMSRLHRKSFLCLKRLYHKCKVEAEHKGGSYRTELTSVARSCYKSYTLCRCTGLMGFVLYIRIITL